MPATPLIFVTGTTSGVNPTANVAEDHYVAGETLNLSDGEALNAAESYSWTAVEVPPGQTSPLLNPLTATPSQVVDAGVVGTFRYRCTVASFTAEILVAVLAGPAADALRAPSHLERDPTAIIALPGPLGAAEAVWNKSGNLRGWMPALHNLVKRVGLRAAELVVAQADIAALEAIPLIDGEHITAQAFTIGTVLSIPHTLGRSYVGFHCTNGLRLTELATQTDKTTQIDLLVEPWELVERKTSDTPATSLTWSGLDGDADQSWEWIIHRCRNSSGGTRNYRLKPNGVIGAAQDSQQMLAAGTTATSGGYASSMQFARQGDAVRWSGKVTLNGMSGYYRTMQSFIGNLTSTPDTSHTTYSAGWTDETALNITSVVWDLDAGSNGFDDYDISLFRFAPKKTAADIWIF